MKLNYIIDHTLPQDVWRDFVRDQPAGNIFHTPEMYQVFQMTEKHQPQLWAATSPDGNPLALFIPVEISLSKSLFTSFVTRRVAYGSVLYVPGPEGTDALDYLLRAFRQVPSRRALFTELRNISDLEEVQPILQRQGFAFEPHLDYIVDLQKSEDEQKKSMYHDVLKNVKRARRMGVIIEEVDARDQIDSAYVVLKKVYKRVQVPLAPVSLFKAAFDVLYPRNMIKILTARVGGQIVGTAVRLLYKDTIFAWYAGALRDFSSFKAHDFLNWSVMDWGRENGFHYFDFGGAGKPDQSYGPRNYKAKFGGHLVNYGRNTIVHAPLRFRLSRLGYTLLRRFL